MTTQQDIIQALNVKPNINPQEEFHERVKFLKQYIQNNKLDGFVLGISGGQDSLLAGFIAQTAINELNQENNTEKYKFVALMLPYGEQKDHQDVLASLKFIKPNNTINFNIKPMVDSFTQTYNQVDFNGMLSDFNKGNVKARVRMITQYAYAGELGKYVVIGTDHAAEALTGFFTKYGDGGTDILPLAGLTKYQGREILKFIKAPDFIFEKVPTADLLDSTPERSDEDELGVSYEEIEDFLLNKPISKESADILIQKYDSSSHKRAMPIAFS